MTVLKELRRALLALLGSAGIAFAICAVGLKTASGNEMSIQVKDRFSVQLWHWARPKNSTQRCALSPGAALEATSVSTGIEVIYDPQRAEVQKNSCAKDTVFKFGSIAEFRRFGQGILCMPGEDSLTEACKEMNTPRHNGISMLR
jgi:hypothetical protein